MTAEDAREQVRRRYAAAATAVTTTGRDALAVLDADAWCAPSTAEANGSCCCGGDVDTAFGSGLYGAEERDELPAEAVAASLGCGNPMAVAELCDGETVLDLGAGVRRSRPGVRRAARIMSAPRCTTCIAHGRRWPSGFGSVASCRVGAGVPLTVGGERVHGPAEAACQQRAVAEHAVHCSGGDK